MAYVIGVSSGIFAAVPEAEKIQYVGPAKKAQYCITKGVQFVQIDLESVAEFQTPNLKEDMKKIREKLGVRFAIHSETKAFGVEIAELDSAIETDYKFGHRRIKDILEKAGEIGSEYVLIHSSESTPIRFLERTLQPAILVDFWGKPLDKFIEKNTFLRDWLIGGGEEKVIGALIEAYDELGDEKESINKEKIEEKFKEKNIKPPNYIWRELIGGRDISRYFAEILRDRIRSEVMYRVGVTGKVHYKDLSPEEKRRVDERIRFEIERIVKDMIKYFIDLTRSRSLHYGPERFAYWLVAKWMEKTDDPLWEPMINATIEYFAKAEGKTVEEWVRSKGVRKVFDLEKKKEVWSIDDDNFRELDYLWVPCVSAKYIWGHLMQDGTTYEDLKKILRKFKMPLILETPMAHRGIEEWLRFPNPLQMYFLVKEVNEKVGFECLAIAMDFEHMLSIKLDPEKVIEALPEGAGRYVRVLHVGYPSALAPAHIPIPLGSEQQVWLYKMLFKLRKKGFGLDPKVDHYIVFERGGGPDPIKQSIIALRKIVECLEKEIPPEKLPPEFYGIATGEIASEERQLAIIKAHAFDPLKGLLMVPEEEHGFLGKAAVEKGKAEIWKKEELR